MKSPLLHVAAKGKNISGFLVWWFHVKSLQLAQLVPAEDLPHKRGF